MPQGKGAIDEIRMTDGSEEKSQTPDAKSQKKSETAAASKACAGVGVIAFKAFIGVWTVAFVIWARRGARKATASRPGRGNADQRQLPRGAAGYLYVPLSAMSLQPETNTIAASKANLRGSME
jgi:hypothetical protein